MDYVIKQPSKVNWIEFYPNNTGTVIYRVISSHWKSGIINAKVVSSDDPLISSIKSIWSSGETSEVQSFPTPFETGSEFGFHIGAYEFKDTKYVYLGDVIPTRINPKLNCEKVINDQLTYDPAHELDDSDIVWPTEGKEIKLRPKLDARCRLQAILIKADGSSNGDETDYFTVTRSQTVSQV